MGGAATPNNSLGLIPDIETLQFIARACNGAVMTPDKVSGMYVLTISLLVGMSGVYICRRVYIYIGVLSCHRYALQNS